MMANAPRFPPCTAADMQNPDNRSRLIDRINDPLNLGAAFL